MRWKGLRTGLLLSAVVWGLLFVGFAEAREFDLPTPEPLPSLTKGHTTDILIRPDTEQVTVVAAKGFLKDGRFSRVGGKEHRELAMNRADDPDTLEDESSTDYTDFIAASGCDLVAIDTWLKARM